MTENEQEARDNVATWGCALAVLFLLAVVGVVVKGCADARRSTVVAQNRVP
jgi:hypothetical protein